MVKIDTSEVKRWTILNVEWKLYKVVDTSHTHTGRWSATYGFKVKDIISWGTNTLSYKSWTTLEQADVSTKNAVYLYNSWDFYSFMEWDTSEIHDIPYEEIEDIAPYLKENLDVFVMIYNEKVIWVILPTTITYKVVETVPGVKWDRAQAGKKPAKLDTWIEVMVPLHVEEWQMVAYNTLTWDVTLA